MNEIIANKKGINDEIFWNYWKHQNHRFQQKIDLIRSAEPKNKKLVNNDNNELINLRSTTNRKGIPDNENPKKNDKYCISNPQLW